MSHRTHTKAWHASVLTQNRSVLCTDDAICIQGGVVLTNTAVSWKCQIECLLTGLGCPDVLRHLCICKNRRKKTLLNWWHNWSGLELGKMMIKVVQKSSDVRCCWCCRSSQRTEWKWRAVLSLSDSCRGFYSERTLGERAFFYSIWGKSLPFWTCVCRRVYVCVTH